MVKIPVTLREFIEVISMITMYRFSPMSVFVSGTHMLDGVSPDAVLREMPDEWLEWTVKDFNWFGNMLVVRI